jgi:hypothetical protein
MDSLIESLKGASTLSQALAVSAGGLIGVFATLAFFFLMIFVAGRLGKKGSD